MGKCLGSTKAYIEQNTDSQNNPFELTVNANGDKLCLPIECVVDDYISSKTVERELVNLGIFAMQFGSPASSSFKPLKNRIIMNPRYNVVYGYGPGSARWSGAKKDDISHGDEPYYCPIGWKKFSIQFIENLDKDKYDNWAIAYHGTGFANHMLILLTGLKCSNNGKGWGTGVYLSPSIKYVSHPRYCKPFKLDLKRIKETGWGSKYIDEFKNFDGKWIQCAFQCRVKPGSYNKYGQTMGLRSRGLLHNGKFDNIAADEIEWVVHGKLGRIIGEDKILITGLMIKVNDRKPKGYN